MAYNHRKAELEWLSWKEKEEKQLRELGVDEDTIQRLHTYDWQQFKSDVAAFISQNRMAPELLICTLDYKMFLTARRGMIDVCPDRTFLVQELLPVLVPMQTGQVQDVPLVLVPRESVQDEKMPAAGLELPKMGWI